MSRNLGGCADGRSREGRGYWPATSLFRIFFRCLKYLNIVCFITSWLENSSAEWWVHQAVQVWISASEINIFHSLFLSKLPMHTSPSLVSCTEWLRLFVKHWLMSNRREGESCLAIKMLTRQKWCIHLRSMRWESKRRFAPWRLFIAAWRSDTCSIFCGEFPESSGVVKYYT